VFTIFPYCHVQFNQAINKVKKESVPFDEQSMIDLSKLTEVGLICDAELLTIFGADKFSLKTAAN
jgi:hypothetical protein